MVFNLASEKAKRRWLASSIRAALVMERHFERISTRILDAQAKKAAIAYRKSGELNEALLAIDQLNPRWNRAAGAHIRRTGEYAARELFKTMKSADWIPDQTKSFDAWRVFFRGFLQRRTADLVLQVNGTTRELIKTAVYQATLEGEGNYAIAKRIYGKISGIGKMSARLRCRTIARTESHTAANYAADSAVDHVPFSVIREWVPAEDDRTRPTHWAMRGEEREKGEAFNVGGYALMYPGDPDGPPEETINCRCRLVYKAKNSLLKGLPTIVVDFYPFKVEIFSKTG